MDAPNFSTPTNVVGLGNVTAPGENGNVGSGDTFTVKDKKKKKFISLKQYLKKHRVG